jgi:hypothetical protein
MYVHTRGEGPGGKIIESGRSGIMVYNWHDMHACFLE